MYRFEHACWDSVGWQLIFVWLQFSCFNWHWRCQYCCGYLKHACSYFGWARRAEGHKSSSVQYGKVHRFLMIELSLPAQQRMTAGDLLKTMRDQIDRLYETSPAIPPEIVKDFKAEHKEDHISRPEIANGLDPIEVYVPVSEIHKSSVNVRVISQQTSPQA